MHWRLHIANAIPAGSLGVWAEMWCINHWGSWSWICGLSHPGSAGSHRSSLRCRKLQFLMPLLTVAAPSKELAGQGGSVLSPPWCTACCAGSIPFGWQGELKHQFYYWSHPKQWGIGAEPLPTFISHFLNLYFDSSFKQNDWLAFICVWWQFLTPPFWRSVAKKDHMGISITRVLYTTGDIEGNTFFWHTVVFQIMWHRHIAVLLQQLNIRWRYLWSAKPVELCVFSGAELVNPTFPFFSLHTYFQIHPRVQILVCIAFKACVLIVRLCCPLLLPVWLNICHSPAPPGLCEFHFLFRIIPFKCLISHPAPYKCKHPPLGCTWCNFSNPIS